MRTLLLHRRGVLFDESWVGPVLELPAPPTADDLWGVGGAPAAGAAADGLPAPLTDDDVAARVGLDRALAQVGRIDALRLWGLHEPSPWEQRLTRWVAARLGVAVPVEPAAARSPFSSVAEAIPDPILPWPAVPPGLDVRCGGDPDLEALGAVRWVRQALVGAGPSAPAEWLSGVLVLIPDDPARQLAWEARLSEAGLPFQSRGWASLGESPVGRWAVGLARLSTAHDIRREDLSAVFDVPLFVMPREGSRGDLRAILRSLRLPALPFSVFKAHARAWFEEKRRAAAARVGDGEPGSDGPDRLAERQSAVETVLAWVAEAVQPAGPAIWQRLLELLGDHRLRTNAALRARTDADGARALAALKACLEELAATAESPTAQRSAAAILAERLAAAGIGRRTRQAAGVRLQTWSTWDGRGAERVVLAGLEDGGWPRVARPVDARARRAAAALGLESPSDALARQLRIVGRALAGARAAALLSWSAEDAEGSEAFRGPALAGQPAPAGGDSGTHGADRTEERDLLLPSYASAHSPGDLALLPVPPGAGEGAAAWRAQAEAHAHRAALAAARAPRVTGVAPGPHSGDIGAPVDDQAWSATALEAMGQCPTKFLLGRLFRAERESDLGTLLDASETGSLLHAAFEQAAVAAIEASTDGTWVIEAPEGASPDEQNAWAARLAGDVGRALDAAAAEHSRRHPTLSAHLTAIVLARWKRAAERALGKEVQSRAGKYHRIALHDPTLSDAATLRALLRAEGHAEVDPAQEAAARRARLEEVLSQIPSQKFTSKDGFTEWFCAAFTGVTKKSVGGAYNKGVDIDSLRQACLDAIQTKEDNDKKALDKHHIGVQNKLRTDRSPRRVVAAEWSFGLPLKPEDRVDGRSTALPLTLALSGGASIQVRGRVDRIDGDPDAGLFSIVDYKSGRSAASKLDHRFGLGLHLQTPLYGAAVSALWPRAPGPLSPPVRVVTGHLHATRTAGEATLALATQTYTRQPAATEGPDATAAAAGADTVSSDAVLQAHLAVTAQRLRTGVFPLAPRACPLQSQSGAGNGYCEFVNACGFDPRAKPAHDPTPAPVFTPAAAPKDPKAETPSTKTAPPLRPLQAPKPSPTEGAARETEARAQACITDISTDVLVSAGAGSGKTTGLVRRYLAALEAGTPPDRILAITFTRKATAEMRHRVREGLVSPSKASKLPPDARRKAILALGAAPILTIDAFAAMVVRELDPTNPIAVSGGADRFRAGWLEHRLAREAAAPDDRLSRLFHALPLSAVQETLGQLLDLDPQRLAALAAVPATDWRTRWVDALQAAWPELNDDRQAILDAGIALAGSPAAETLAPVLEVVQSLGVLGVLTLAAFPTWTSPKLRNTPAPQLQEIAKRWHKKTGALGAVSEAIDTAAGAQDSAAPAADIIAAVDACLRAEAERTADVVAIAHAWMPALVEARVQAGACSYGDVLSRAIGLLEDPGRAQDIRDQLGFAHIFIDELQDTNSTQMALFNALHAALARTGPAPKRFLVGDVKQSIYRFRGAEVDVFTAQTANPSITQASLDACWRAVPALTSALNPLFERILAPEDGPGLPHDPQAAVPWAALAPRWPTASHPTAETWDTPPIELLEFIDPTAGEGDTATDAPEPDDAEAGSKPTDDKDASDSDGATDSETDADIRLDPAETVPVVARIQELRQSNPEWSIAVLTHSWDLATRWGEALRAAGVPAFVEGGRGLLRSPVVTPILAVLDALEREDDLGMLDVLRGPLVGLSDPTLWAIRNGQGVQLPDFLPGGSSGTPGTLSLRRLRHTFTFDPDAAARWLEAKRGSPLSPAARAALAADRDRVQRWSEWWDDARLTLGLQPLSRTLSRILDATGYRHTLAQAPLSDARTHLAALRRFERVVAALAAEEPNALAVVRELRRRAAAGEDESASSNPYAGAAITVTVVHQAKGLAWDVVVIPSPKRAKLSSKDGSGKPVRVISSDGEPVDLLSIKQENPKDIFATKRSVSTALVAQASLPFERAEQRRLLYVACTRARHRLIIGGLPLSPSAIQKTRAGLKADLGGKAALRNAKNWAEILFLAIYSPITGATADPTADTLAPVIWEEGKHYRRVSPALQEPPAGNPEAAIALPTDFTARLRTVTTTPITILNPSAATDRQPATLLPEVPPTDAPAPDAKHPFASAREAGTIAHRAFATWGWRGTPDDTLATLAITDTLAPAVPPEPTLAVQRAHLLALLRRTEARQPALAAALRDAASRGDLFHEVRVQVDTPTARIEGSIDLLWQDQAGAWHLLDYKATDADLPIAGDANPSLDRRIQHYLPQVQAYATALRGALPNGASLATYGLWFVREGRVLRWQTAD